MTYTDYVNCVVWCREFFPSPLIPSAGIAARFVLAGEPDQLNPATISPGQIADWMNECAVERLVWVDDMPKLLAKCHIVCLPSYREGLPKSLIEAAAASRPIVTTDVPGCCEVVHDGDNGLLVPPRDADALAEALSRLITDPELRQQRGCARPSPCGTGIRFGNCNSANAGALCRGGCLRTLVTGATGFVGTALVDRLVGAGRFDVRAAVRHKVSRLPVEVESVVVGDLTPDTVWQQALAGVETIVHLAARVHVMRDAAADPLAEFRWVNVRGTLNLARQAAAAGVRRFVFLSSVKVNGEGTLTPNSSPGGRGRVYKESDPPAPQDAYGISKHEAELGLREIAAETGMGVVIIRSPLVYGPGVKANFQALMRAVARGIPLPLGAIHNRRSLVALGNLVDFILTCIEHPAAANETFLVSDGEDLSTTELIRRLARAMGRPARLIPVPTTVLMAGATLLGKRKVAARLCGSLQVDITKTRTRLNWSPPVTVDDALRATARHFLDSSFR